MFYAAELNNPNSLPPDNQPLFNGGVPELPAHTPHSSQPTPVPNSECVYVYDVRMYCYVVGHALVHNVQTVSLILDANVSISYSVYWISISH